MSLDVLHNLLDGPIPKNVAPFLPTIFSSLFAYLIAPFVSARMYSHIEYKRALRHLAQENAEPTGQVAPAPACAKRCSWKNVVGIVLAMTLPSIILHFLPKGVTDGLCWALVLFLPRAYYVFFMLRMALPLALVVKSDLLVALQTNPVRTVFTILSVLSSGAIVSLALFTHIEIFSWLTFTATVLFCSLGSSKRPRTFSDAAMMRVGFSFVGAVILLLLWAIFTVTEEIHGPFERVRKAFYELKGLDSWVVYWLDWVVPAIVAGVPGTLMSYSLRFDRRIHLDKLGTEEFVLVQNESEKDKSAHVSVQTVSIGSFPKPYFTASLVSWLMMQAALLAITSFTPIRAYVWDEFLIIVTALFSVLMMDLAIVIVAAASKAHRRLGEYEEEWDWTKDARTREQIIARNRELEKELIQKLKQAGYYVDEGYGTQDAGNREQIAERNLELETDLIQKLKDAGLVEEGYGTQDTGRNLELERELIQKLKDAGLVEEGYGTQDAESRKQIAEGKRDLEKDLIRKLQDAGLLEEGYGTQDARRNLELESELIEKLKQASLVEEGYGEDARVREQTAQRNLERERELIQKLKDASFI